MRPIPTIRPRDEAEIQKDGGEILAEKARLIKNQKNIKNVGSVTPPNANSILQHIVLECEAPMAAPVRHV